MKELKINYIPDHTQLSWDDSPTGKEIYLAWRKLNNYAQEAIKFALASGFVVPIAGMSFRIVEDKQTKGGKNDNKNKRTRTA